MGLVSLMSVSMIPGGTWAAMKPKWGRMSREITCGHCLRRVLIRDARAEVAKVGLEEQVVGKARGAKPFGQSIPESMAESSSVSASCR